MSYLSRGRKAQCQKKNRKYKGHFFQAVFIAGFVCCLSNISAQAQTLRLFDGQGGLARLTVNVLAQDSDGFMYAGTEAGLYVSSGGDFMSLNKPDGTPFSHTTSIAANSDGDLLVASGSELWIRSRDTFEKLQFNGIGKLSLSSLGSDFLVLDGNGPARGGGLWRVHPYSPNSKPKISVFIDSNSDFDKFSENPLLNRSLSALATTGKTVWVICGTALCHYQAGHVDVFDSSKGVPSENWMSLATSKGGKVFGRSATKFVEISESNNVRVEDIPSAVNEYRKIQGDGSFLLLALDGSVLTPGRDALVVRSVDGHWKQMAWPSGFVPQAVALGFIDRENGIWMDSPGRGLMRLAGYPFWETFSADEKPAPENVTSVKRDDLGNLWIAAGNGLFAYEVNKEENSRNRLLFRQNITGLNSFERTADGALWAAEKGKGVVRIDPVTHQVRRIVSPAPTTGSLLLDTAGRMWIGTNQGLIRVEDPLKPISHLPSVFALWGRNVISFCFDQFGRLLVLTDNVLFQQESGGDLFNPRFDVESIDLGVGRAISISSNNEVFLLGSNGKIKKIVLDENNASAVFNDDIENNKFNTIFRDSRSWIWVGGSAGIDVLTPKGWSHFDSGSGLISSRVVANSITEDEDGSIWIGTSEGLMHFVNANLFSPLPELHTKITLVELGGEKIRTNTKFTPEENSDFKIDFIAPTFVGNENIYYKFQLFDVDSVIRQEKNSSFVYKNVNLKNISFQVQAVDTLNHRYASTDVILAHAQGTGLSLSRIIFWCSMTLIPLFVVFGIAYKKIKSARDRKIEFAVRGRTRVMEEMQAQLLHQSKVDVLTGLLNRRAIFDEMGDVVSALSPQ